MKIPWDDFEGDIARLIREEKLRVVFSDKEDNPHILRFGCESVQIQLNKLPTANISDCGYPTPEYLKNVVNRQDYEGKPYTLSLALGEPQLSYKAFDLSVLEFYRNDPRYEYMTNDISGQISLTDEYYDSEQIPESDRIFLDTFGFCYDDKMNRAVAVFVRYISDLSPEHQQIWKAKELQGNYKLHPDYYLNTIIGDWSEYISIFEAFTMELQTINQMSIAMERPPLFKIDFTQQSKPRSFSFLVRPTLKEYDDFVLLLDKLLSDNISKDFFMGEIHEENEEVRRDGKIIIQNKGTITLLNEWVHNKFHSSDWESFDTIIKTLRDIRYQRQPSAHAINENKFDPIYINKQRELMIAAYNVLRTIRLMFACHQKCKNVEVDEALIEGKIRTF